MEFLLFICGFILVAANFEKLFRLPRRRERRRRLPPRIRVNDRRRGAVRSANSKPTEIGVIDGPPAGETFTGPAYVIDGDTIVVQKINIRLFGIDAPEIEDPYGRNAKFAMMKLCKGQTITVHIIDWDGFGRTVANCYLPDGRDLSAEMVKQGQAIDWPKFSGGIYTQYEVPGIRKKLWRCDALQKGRLASRILD